MTTGYQRPRTKQPHHRSGAARNPASGEGAARQDALIDPSDTGLAEIHELPGAEQAAEELDLEILALQADEFTCGSCFLVRHRSQLAREKNGQAFCRDCEG